MNINKAPYGLFNSKTLKLRSTGFASRQLARDAKRAATNPGLYRIARMDQGKVVGWVR